MEEFDVNLYARLLSDEYSSHQSQAYLLLKDNRFDKCLSVCDGIISDKKFQIESLPNYDADKIQALELSMRYWTDVKQLVKYYFNNMDKKQIFTHIYNTNYWASKESKSGGGSEIESTKEIRSWLEEIIRKYGIKSMTDCACGDFNWMRKVIFPEDFIYTGCDIVGEMIFFNRVKYGKLHTYFHEVDLTSNPVPDSELLFCKDLFLHLSFEDCNKIIENFKRSNAKYLIISNGIKHSQNLDKRTGGDWRPLNMMIEPFNFPEYIELLDAGVTQMSMHLISDLRVLK